jgi:hypothetical protein
MMALCRALLQRVSLTVSCLRSSASVRCDTTVSKISCVFGMALSMSGLTSYGRPRQRDPAKGSGRCIRPGATSVTIIGPKTYIKPL